MFVFEATLGKIAMARLPYLQKSDLPPDKRDLLSNDINLFRALVHNREAVRHWSPFGKYIRYASKLDPRLREMAIIQVGYLTRQEYEYSHHVKIGRDFGVSDDDIRAIADETAGRATGLDPLAKLVLRAAREMTSALAMSDETYVALSKELDNERMIDLILSIAFYNAVVRILETLQIDVEDAYLKYLDEFPLPPR
jgi:alkylhydroperoxidase family enzyme